MRLQRLLFYVLLTIFATAVVVVCVVDASSAWSRIGTGLITGSFIGMIGALVNYIHQRSVYWKEFADLCWKVADSIRKYRIEATRYNDDLKKSSKEQIILDAIKSRNHNDECINEMKKNCESLALRCQDDLYVPFFFWNRSIAPFYDLCDKIQFDFCSLHGERMMCRTFDMIDKSMSKEEMDIVIGDPDEFYEDTYKRCLEYQEILEYDCHQFSQLIHKVLGHGFGKTLTKSTRKILETSADFVIFGIEDIEVKDVRSLRVDETPEDTDEETDPENTFVVKLKNMKNVISRILEGIIDHLFKYGYVWLIGLGCVVAFVAITFLELNVGFRFCLADTQSIADGWNRIWLGLSYSYLAGVILYYFTARLPYVLECKRMRGVIISKIEDIGVTIENMNVEFRSGDQNPNLEEIDQIISLMTPEKWRSTKKKPFFAGETVFDAFVDGYRDVQRQIGQLINDYGKYLSTEELLLLEEIRSTARDIFIRMGEGHRIEYLDNVYTDILNPRYEEMVRKYLKLAKKCNVI